MNAIGKYFALPYGQSGTAPDNDVRAFELYFERLGGRDGLTKAAVLPTFIIKEEDRDPLKKWQIKRKISICVWHAFFDEAFGISLADAERLFTRGDIAPTEQVFQSLGVATTKKVIYKIYYRHTFSWPKLSKNPNWWRTQSQTRIGISSRTSAITDYHRHKRNI